MKCNHQDFGIDNLSLETDETNYPQLSKNNNRQQNIKTNIENQDQNQGITIIQETPLNEPPEDRSTDITLEFLSHRMITAITSITSDIINTVTQEKNAG